VPTNTERAAMSTAGEPHTSAHPEPVAHAPVDGAVVVAQRGRPVRASSAMTCDFSPWRLLCTSVPTITIPSATTGDDSISLGSLCFPRPVRPISKRHRSFPSLARSA
jgi:hypothetical protein